MKILAVDTATRACSVAVMADDTLLAEITLNHGQTHAKFMMEMIHRALELGGLPVDEVDGFAVTIGPGSFTGLRIGLSTIKGFAAATGKPVVGVSTLAALSYPFLSTDKLICPLLDARRGEVYAARYRFVNAHLTVLKSPYAATIYKAIEDIDEQCILVGDGALQNKKFLAETFGQLAVFPAPGQHIIKASNVASISMKRFAENDTDDLSSIVPIYLRKSDAEENRGAS